MTDKDPKENAVKRAAPPVKRQKIKMLKPQIAMIDQRIAMLDQSTTKRLKRKL